MHRLLLLALVACGSSAAPTTAPGSDGQATATPGRGKTIYVALGDMGSNTSAGDELAPVLRAAIDQAFRADPHFELDRAAPSGYQVDGVFTVSVERAGRATRITCKVDMLVGTYPSKAIFGLPTSSAEVGSTNAAADIEAGRRDCIRTVAADLVSRHVIPMLRRRSVEQRDMLPPATGP